MIDSINESLQQSAIALEQVANTVCDMSNRSETRMTNINELSDKISDITNGAKKLLEAMAIIKDIDMQVNLLAINTAIQSAHLPNNLGRPFEVVAKEMRRLSDKSKTSMSEVNNMFSDVIKSCDSINDIVNISIDGVHRNNADLQELSAIVEELSASVEEISNNLNEVIVNYRKVK